MFVNFFQKKRIISSTGENLVFNGGVKDIYPHLPSITGCDFMGLKIGSSQNFKGLGNTDLDQKQPTSSFGFSPTEQQVINYPFLLPFLYSYIHISHEVSYGRGTKA